MECQKCYAALGERQLSSHSWVCWNCWKEKDLDLPNGHIDKDLVHPKRYYCGNCGSDNMHDGLRRRRLWCADCSHWDDGLVDCISDSQREHRLTEYIASMTPDQYPIGYKLYIARGDHR